MFLCSDPEPPLSRGGGPEHVQRALSMRAWVALTCSQAMSRRLGALDAAGTHSCAHMLWPAMDCGAPLSVNLTWGCMQYEWACTSRTTCADKKQ